MAKQPNIVLLDVSVWLDNYVPNRASSADSRKLLAWLTQHDVTITYPITSLDTIFFLVQQSFKVAAHNDGLALQQEDAEAIQSIAWACIENMAELGTPVAADASDFWIARKFRSIHTDLEDDFVLAAAERAQADYLITSDKTLMQKSTVPALSPHDFLQIVCA